MKVSWKIQGTGPCGLSNEEARHGKAAAADINECPFLVLACNMNLLFLFLLYYFYFHALLFFLHFSSSPNTQLLLGMDFLHQGLLRLWKALP